MEKEIYDLKIKSFKALDWKMIWGIPAVMAAIVLVFFTILFKEPKKAEETEEIEAEKAEA